MNSTYGAAVDDDGPHGGFAAFVAPFAENLRNSELRRAQLSFAAAWSAEWAFTVGLSVYAFRAGGAAAVGLVAAIRLLPSAVAAPLLLPLVDRFPRSRLLATVSGTRAVLTAVAALVVAGGGPEWAVYVAAVASTVAGTLFRPTHSAFLPSLCQLPHELAGANAVRGLLDSLSILVGPAVAALLLHWYGPGAVFVAAAAASLVSAVLMLRVHSHQPIRDARAGGPSAASEFL